MARIPLQPAFPVGPPCRLRPRRPPSAGIAEAEPADAALLELLAHLLDCQAAAGDTDAAGGDGISFTTFVGAMEQLRSQSHQGEEGEDSEGSH
jgi:hypothetical protein